MDVTWHKVVQFFGMFDYVREMTAKECYKKSEFRMIELLLLVIFVQVGCWCGCVCAYVCVHVHARVFVCMCWWVGG